MGPWIESEGSERFLALWPTNVGAGMINGRPAILTTNGQLLVETGSVAQVGGSEADLAAAEGLVGPIPEPCAAGSFWVVADVLNRP